MVARDILEYSCSVDVIPGTERNFCSSLVINLERCVCVGERNEIFYCWNFYDLRTCFLEVREIVTYKFRKTFSPYMCWKGFIGDPLRFLLPSITLQMEVDTLTSQGGRRAKILIGFYLKTVTVVDIIGCGRVLIYSVVLDKAHEKTGDCISVSSRESWGQFRNGELHNLCSWNVTR